jgi:hypothetical protein
MNSETAPALFGYEDPPLAECLRMADRALRDSQDLPGNVTAGCFKLKHTPRFL